MPFCPGMRASLVLVSPKSEVRASRARDLHMQVHRQISQKQERREPCDPRTFTGAARPVNGESPSSASCSLGVSLLRLDCVRGRRSTRELRLRDATPADSWTARFRRSLYASARALQNLSESHEQLRFTWLGVTDHGTFFPQ